MLSHTMRASRQGAVLLARQHAVSARRAFATSGLRQADIVQDLYLRELKNYKIPAVKASDADGQVKQFKAPAAPKSPEEGDLANDLKSYESQEPEMEGQSSDGSAASDKHPFFEDEDLDAEEHSKEGGH